MKSFKKLGKLAKFVAAALAAVVVYAGVRFGPDLMTAYRQGFFEKQAKREYTPDHEGNLRAIHTALMLYHESEERFPMANGWMDAIKPLLRTADLSPEDALKKLKRPGADSRDDVWGYSINKSCAGKYKDDIASGSATVLVFESQKTEWNAASNDEESKKALGITVGGDLKKPE